MHLFRPGKLASAFAEDKISETEKFKYFLIWTILGSVFYLMAQSTNHATSEQATKIFNAVIGLAISVSGVTICFLLNRDKIGFVERIICLSVPIWICLLLITMASTFVLALLSVPLGYKTLFDEAFKNPTFYSVFGNIYTAIYFGWVALLIQKISKAKIRGPIQNGTSEKLK